MIVLIPMDSIFILIRLMNVAYYANTFFARFMPWETAYGECLGIFNIQYTLASKAPMGLSLFSPFTVKLVWSLIVLNRIVRMFCV